MKERDDFYLGLVGVILGAFLLGLYAASIIHDIQPVGIFKWVFLGMYLIFFMGMLLSNRKH